MTGILYTSLLSTFLWSLLFFGLAIVGLATGRALVISGRHLFALLAVASAPLLFSALEAFTELGQDPNAAIILMATGAILGVSRIATRGFLFLGIRENVFREALRESLEELCLAHEGDEAGKQITLPERGAELVIREHRLLGSVRLLVRPPSDDETLVSVAGAMKDRLAWKAQPRVLRHSLIQLGLAGLLFVLASVELVAGIAVPAFQRWQSSLLAPEEEPEPGSPGRGSAWVGAKAPDFELETLEGETFRLSEQLGDKIVVLNFFATWCPPCRAEMPGLVRFHKTYRDGPLVMFGIDARETREEVAEFRDEFGVSYPLGIDSGAVMKRFGVRSFPRTVVIGLDGRIKQYRIGSIEDVEAILGDSLADIELAIFAAENRLEAEGGYREARPELLASYSFEDEPLLGVEGLAFPRDAVGKAEDVRSTTTYRYSGYDAIEIRDRPGNGGFPELQGPFPVASRGRLFFHFALLTTTPEEEMSIALAGPRLFTPVKDGIGFWLHALDGELFQISERKQDRLIQLEPFVWYLVDVAYDVDAGTYDLSIGKEGQSEAAVTRSSQPNVPGAPGSTIDRLSFIGDNGSDRSAAHYFIDDVVVSRDPALESFAFDAPGRHGSFCDRLDALKAVMERSLCPPVLRAEDFGSSQRFGILGAYRSGCVALRRDDPGLAWAYFAPAVVRDEGPNLVTLAAAVPLARLGRVQEAEAHLAAWQSENPGDLRSVAVAALVAAIAGERQGKGEKENEKEASFRRYAVFFWGSDFEAAASYAAETTQNLSRQGLPATEWRRRAADAYFCGGDLPRARELYERELNNAADAALMTKLSDLVHLQQDLDAETQLRRRLGEIEP